MMLKLMSFSPVGKIIITKVLRKKNRCLNYVFIIAIAFFFSACIEKGNTIDRIINQPEDKIIKEFGKPKRSSTFILSDTLYEYQYGLLSIYEDSNGKNIEIKESLWILPGRKKLCIWYKHHDNNWIVIDNLLWSYDFVKH
jgi:hypothetical protein